ncbi:hypothetical protein FGO68_gene4644 [Halteria grandinella]|uniref:AB hydrolase-1 domain-containing protein n=1 Tax=Halteria grandinella TaxID=5974 RepID=A0A8J8T149_HALGN|nr:hypothetical protein FGO68_gene4644 [Halteria grandinella]
MCLKQTNKPNILELHYHPESKVADKLNERSKLSQLIFTPSIWLRGGNLQTLINPLKGIYLKAFMPYQYKREIFTFKDGGTIALDWHETIPEGNATPGQRQRPIVAIMPGLASDSNDIYIVNLVREGQRNGYHPIVINYRAASGVPLTNEVWYSQGSTGDLMEPLQHIYTRYCKDRDLFLIGNSVGAQLSGSLMGKVGDKTFIKACALVQPPMNLRKCGDNMASTNFGLYSRFLALGLKIKLRPHLAKLRPIYKEKYDLDIDEALASSKTIMELDQNFTVKVFGFGTIDNYLDKVSCCNYLSTISNPTFILMAKDDPIVGRDTIEYDLCKANQTIILGVTDSGGHLGYFESIMGTEQWFTRPVYEFLNCYK